MRSMSNNIKRVAAIHDMSGFGRCSLTVAMPVISAMGHQCCPLPAAYFSAHTGFDGFTFHDMTDQMLPALRHWAEMSISFDAIYSGFLASPVQMGIVRQARRLFPEALLLVDPVMGDHGRPYKTYTTEMCSNMAELAEAADIITPNVTEAAIILGKAYDASPASASQALDWLEELSDNGRRSVALTGLSLSDGEVGPGWLDSKCGTSGIISLPFVGMEYHGTGDLFASCLLGALLSDVTFEDSARLAAEFVRDCAKLSWSDGTPANHGVRFESLLGRLSRGYRSHY